MNIGGYQPFSLSDYPGCPAAIVFTQGCNLHCPFCHNAMLIKKKAGAVEREEVFASLSKRRNFIQGVVVTGGEPSIQSDLPEFCRALKRLGFFVKLDTNGTRPEMIEELIMNRCVDYLAMDVKAPPYRYSVLAGVEVEWSIIADSIRLVANSGVAHHFRTTVVGPLLDERDIAEICRLIPPGSKHVLQEFRPELARDPALRKSAGMRSERPISSRTAHCEDISETKSTAQSVIVLPAEHEEGGGGHVHKT